MTYLTNLPPHIFKPPADSPANITYRLIEPEDCYLLHKACYVWQPAAQFYDHFQHLLKWQANGRAYWLVAELERAEQTGHALCGRGLCGSGQLIIYSHKAELANLSVTAVRRNKGIGTAIITILTAVARSIGLSYVEISVVSSNTRALSLYQRLGFTKDDRRRLLDDEWAIILRRTLLATEPNR